ncbi:MAG TPA: FAD-binding oxidoreductase [Woeseiaceae bacterium]|nr:FAD-binding oxidoreductase [Woeseiaceae bacterium]
MNPEYQRKEHTNSYYAATINEPTSYPELRGRTTSDVCVVGAGFTGVATTLTLAERGYTVTLVEANRVGWGASGRNGGQMINGMSGLRKIAARYGEGIAGLVRNLKWRGNDIIRERVQKYAIDCDLRDGFVEVATKPRQLAWFEEFAAEREAEASGFDYEVWDRKTTEDMLGTAAFHGGFACYRDGHLHPLNLCIGEARAAESLGARIFEQSPVTTIRHGVRPRVITAQGEVEADAVVLAGNAYSRLEPKHLDNLIFPAGSYIIATEPLTQRLADSINRKNVAVCDLNNVVDYYRLSADRRLLYGGACNYSGRDPASIRSYILPRMLTIYPRLKDVRIDYEWGGKIGITLRRIPVVGRIGSNVYYCQGYSGHGVCPTHVMGEVMADAVAGTMERFDLFADIKPIRIPGSQWFGNQLVALGMLYFKLKDRL